jgi:hypothetical protein
LICSCFLCLNYGVVHKLKIPSLIDATSFTKAPHKCKSPARVNRKTLRLRYQFHPHFQQPIQIKLINNSFTSAFCFSFMFIHLIHSDIKKQFLNNLCRSAIQHNTFLLIKFAVDFIHKRLWLICMKLILLNNTIKYMIIY